MPVFLALSWLFLSFCETVSFGKSSACFLVKFFRGVMETVHIHENLFWGRCRFAPVFFNQNLHLLPLNTHPHQQKLPLYPERNCCTSLWPPMVQISVKRKIATRFWSSGARRGSRRPLKSLWPREGGSLCISQCGDATKSLQVSSSIIWWRSVLFQMFVMFPEPTQITCIASAWPQHLGFSLLYGALLLKTWRWVCVHISCFLHSILESQTASCLVWCFHNASQQSSRHHKRTMCFSATTNNHGKWQSWNQSSLCQSFHKSTKPFCFSCDGCVKEKWKSFLNFPFLWHPIDVLVTF